MSMTILGPNSGYLGNRTILQESVEATYQFEEWSIMLQLSGVKQMKLKTFTPMRDCMMPKKAALLSVIDAV